MQNPNCLVMVDNCYGEFVESIEPPMVVRTIFVTPFHISYFQREKKKLDKGNKLLFLVFRVQI